MRISSVIAYALCAAGALAQTPPGTSPSTNTNLGVSYGSTPVAPNVLLPETLVATQPTIHSNTTYPATYMLLLVDLSIPLTSLISTSTSSLVPGLQANRTTRLHWWILNVTQSPNGTFAIPPPSNTTTSSPAVYGGPMPPAGDIPHTYTFYLLPQPENYSLPTAAQQGAYNPASVYARMNFSIEALVAVVGAPLAGNYFRVQNSSAGVAAATTSAIGTAGLNSSAVATGNGTVGSAPSASASATSAIYTGEGARILAANAALIAVGICMFVWL